MCGYKQCRSVFEVQPLRIGLICNDDSTKNSNFMSMIMISIIIYYYRNNYRCGSFLVWNTLYRKIP